jgi:hypothetical protein
MDRDYEVSDDATAYFQEADRPFHIDQLEMLLFTIIVLPFFFWIHIILISGLDFWQAVIVSVALGFGEVLASLFLIGALIFRRKFKVTSTSITLTYPRVFLAKKPRIRRTIARDEIAAAQLLKGSRKSGKWSVDSTAWSMNLRLRDGCTLALSSGDSTQKPDCISAIERFIAGIPSL